MHRWPIVIALFCLACGQPSAQQVKPKENPPAGKPGTGNESKTTLVTDEEPGQRMIISGTVYAKDGETPLAGVTVYVYQTDDRGYYAPHDAMDNKNPRLNGTMVTGTEGRYEFTTIKPGPYPGGGTPAHVHYVLTAPGLKTLKQELHFAGDPYLSKKYVKKEAAIGRFSSVTRLEPDANGILHGIFNIRME